MGQTTRRENIKFNPTPENIQKIIEMNDGLYKRFRMVYDDLVAMKAKVDSDIKEGCIRCSGYTIFPEYFFCYDYEDDGIPTADGTTLMDLSDETRFFFPSCQLTGDSEIPDFEEDFIQHTELNWNIEDFNLPELANHQIYYFMHNIFIDANTFCIADIPYLKPDDLLWQITVQYEQFNK